MIIDQNAFVLLSLHFCFCCFLQKWNAIFLKESRVYFAGVDFISLASEKHLKYAVILDQSPDKMILICCHKIYRQWKRTEVYLYSERKNRLWLAVISMMLISFIDATCRFSNQMHNSHVETEKNERNLLACVNVFLSICPLFILQSMKFADVYKNTGECFWVHKIQSIKI